MIERRNAPWQPRNTARAAWDGSVLRSLQFGDIYFPVDDGLAESAYVFVAGNHLDQRFSQLRAGQRFTIIELGFGSGLNFMATVDAWRRWAPSGAQLHYVGIDAYPLPAAVAKAVAASWPALFQQVESVYQHWPHPIAGTHRRHLDQARVTLDLWWEPATDALADLASHRRRWVDAWYLDGFAPAQNPDMWSTALWRDMSRLSRDGATLATFSAAGAVRRGLAEAGFAMHKRPGYGRKRECLSGTLVKPIALAETVTPWDQAPIHSAQTAIVIGAGLAGAHIARALARRGFEVKVLEAQQIAAGGSGNRQGVTYTRLSRRFGALSDFALSSYQFALPEYRELAANCDLNMGQDGDFCGYLQLSEDTETLQYLREVLAPVSHFAQVVDQQEASAIAGVAVRGDAIWYPEAAWLHPAAICRALLQHEHITTQQGLGPISIRRQPDGAHWACLSASGEHIASAPVVVIASATYSNQFAPLSWLPLQVIRGQTSQIRSEPPLSDLRCIVCHRGYLPPSVGEEHCIGASFGPNDDSLEERHSEHQHNMDELMRAIPALAAPPVVTGGRVALRCNTSDYLPVAGPAVNAEQFAERYSPLRTRSRQFVATAPAVHEGLWCLAGLGSRGLTAAPLAAESLASQICGEVPPLPRYLHRAISPARFLQRKLKRGAL